MSGSFVRRWLGAAFALVALATGSLASAPGASDFAWMEQRTQKLADPARARVRAHHSLDVINPHPHAPRSAVEHAFFPDPIDMAPLGGRNPLILVHGFDSDQSHLPFDPALNNHWDAFRFSPGYHRLRQFMKPYIFTYRPFADLRDVGTWLAEEVRGKLLPDLPEGRRIVVMSISGGALVSRYAFSEEDLAPKLSYVITLNGANRGSVLASMIGVKKSIKKRIGWLYSSLLRWSRKGKEPTPGILSLTYDNFDGTITEADEARHGVVVNHALREFNQTDPNRHKVIAYQNRPTWLIGKGAYGVDYSIRRRILRKMHPTWETADPIIHKRSGLLAGVGLIRRRFFTGLDHWGIADGQVMTQVVQDLSEIVRVLRVQNRVEGPSMADDSPAPVLAAPGPDVFPDVDGPLPPGFAGE